MSSIRSSSGALVVALAILVLGGCGSDSEGDPTLTVYLSAPLSGPRADDGQDVADAARLALEEAGGEAGGTEVTLEVLDDANDDGWDAAATGANARAATEDTTAIAYIGELDSGASRTSIPITNQAQILQVSPGASAVDLTRESPTSEDVPELQGEDERTFARVIPSDRAQGQAAAAWMEGEGVSSVRVDSDASGFADSLVDGLEAPPSELEVTAGDGVSDAVYLAAAKTLGVRAIAGAGEGSLYGSDAQLDGGPLPFSRSRPVRLTSSAMDPSQLPPEAAGFLAAYEDASGREPGRYAAYGYEAMAAVLDAIDRADDSTDRGQVVDAFLETTDRDSILGTYSIDEVGDTTLGSLGGYEVRGPGGPRPTREPLQLP